MDQDLAKAVWYVDVRGHPTNETDHTISLSTLNSFVTMPPRPKAPTSRSAGPNASERNKSHRIPKDLVEQFPALWFINFTADKLYGTGNPAPEHINMNTVVAEFYRSNVFTYYNESPMRQKGAERRNHMAVRKTTTAMNDNMDWLFAQTWKDVRSPKKLRPEQILAALCVLRGEPQKVWISTALWESHVLPLVYDTENLPAFWAGSRFYEEDWVEARFGKPRIIKNKTPKQFERLDFNVWFGTKRRGWPSYVIFGASQFEVTGFGTGWIDDKNPLDTKRPTKKTQSVKTSAPEKNKEGRRSLRIKEEVPIEEMLREVREEVQAERVKRREQESIESESWREMLNDAIEQEETAKQNEINTKKRKANELDDDLDSDDWDDLCGLKRKDKILQDRIKKKSKMRLRMSITNLENMNRLTKAQWEDFQTFAPAIWRDMSAWSESAMKMAKKFWAEELQARKERGFERSKFTREDYERAFAGHENN